MNKNNKQVFVDPFLDILIWTLMAFVAVLFVFAIQETLAHRTLDLDDDNFRALVKCLDDLEENETCVVEYTFTNINDFDDIEVVRMAK